MSEKKPNLATGSEALESLKVKLETLTTRLQGLAASAAEDIEIATALQKMLHPNRLENISGLRCVSRFIRGSETGTEGFDLFTADKNNTSSWFIASQTETFGLSSVLMQTLVYLTTRLSLGKEKELSPEEFFKLLAQSLGTTKKAGKFRLLVAKFHHHTLKWQGVSRGFAPFLRREREGKGLSAWNFESEFYNCLEKQPEFFKPHLSSDNVGENSYVNFNFQISPGSRLSFLSPLWAGPTDWNNYKTQLKSLIKQSKFLGEPVKGEVDLIDDLNEFLTKAEDAAQSKSLKCDITSLVWDIDTTKLQLK